jgi:DNA polymerase III alpha subunit
MGFMHIGSGANSSYCLGITNICPLELDLYFERF